MVPDESSDSALREHVKHTIQLYSAPDISSVALNTTLDRALREHVKMHFLA